VHKLEALLDREGLFFVIVNARRTLAEIARLNENSSNHCPGISLETSNMANNAPPLGEMDLDEFRQYGHKIVDWIAEYLAEPERYPVLSRSLPG
jgi:hypothetical protein